MILDCILTATNTCPKYMSFIPIFIKTWNKLYRGVDVKIILIAQKIPEKFFEFEKNIILFPPFENLSTGFQSQYIRLLYPSLLQQYKNGVLITDIDMLPMNRSYFTKPIEGIPNTKFIHMRGALLEKKQQVCICYNIATPSVWASVTQVTSMDDIFNCFQSFSQGRQQVNWFRDQQDLFQFLTVWNAKTGNWVKLTDTFCKFKRLNRKHFDIRNFSTRKAITNHEFSDYHCLRPMTKYSKINSRIYYLL